jgi:hypothetical protein
MTTAAWHQWPGSLTRVMLLGEQAASKTATWGSNPHARADCRRGSTEKGIHLARARFSGTHAGANPVVGSCDGETSRWCSGLHWPLRRFRPWFDSMSGY